MIKCFILGTQSSCEILVEFINQYPLAKLVGYSSPDAFGLSQLKECQPDIVFADILLLSALKPALIKACEFSTIIYLSSGIESAFAAFEAMGFDYLTQPFSFQRFEMSLNKFVNLSLTVPSHQKQGTITDSFFIRSGPHSQKEILVKCREIVFIEGMQNYLVLNLLNDRKIIFHYTMKEMLERLPQNVFIRVHKSIIINYETITSIEGNNIILNDNDKLKIIIGNTYRQAFKDRKNQKLLKKGRV